MATRPNNRPARRGVPAPGGSALLLPELDAAPDDGDRSGAAGGPVRAELVVEAATRTLHGVFQRPVDVDAQRAADHVHGVDPYRRADRRAGRDRVAAVHRVEPAAALDGEQEERSRGLERLLQADPAAAHTRDPEEALELPGTAAVCVITPLRPLLSTLVGATEREDHVIDLPAAELLQLEPG